MSTCSNNIENLGDWLSENSVRRISIKHKKEGFSIELFEFGIKKEGVYKDLTKGIPQAIKDFYVYSTNIKIKKFKEKIEDNIKENKHYKESINIMERDLEQIK